MTQQTRPRFPLLSAAALIIALLLCLTLARRETARSPIVPPSLRQPFQVSAWVPYWDADRVRISFSNHAAELNEVNFFWYQVLADGSLRAFAGAQDAALLELARTHGLRVLPTVMNDFDGARVAALLADETTREAHIQTVLELVERLDYDGIEIDYEALPAESRDDFSAFIEALAAALHEKGRLLSIAVHPKTSDKGSWHGPESQDWPRLGAAVDAFKIMVYEYHWRSSSPGPIAPLDWADAVLTYAESAVPAEKIWLGLPFYGRDWAEGVGEGLVWRAVADLMRQHSPVVRRDASSAEIFFAYTLADVPHTVYIPDAQAIAIKVRAARQQHPDIAGLAIWRLGGESAQHWQAIWRER
ncbi:MAG: glycosyl hydrolase family 18 protein [Chloroflexota bacterium]